MIERLQAFFLSLLCLMVSGCATCEGPKGAAEERFVSAVIARMAVERSGFHAELNSSAGFLVVEVTPAPLPGLSRVSQAWLVDSVSGERRAARVSNLGVLGGYGESRYDLVLFFEERAAFARAWNDGWSYSTAESLRLRVVYFAPPGGSTIRYDLGSISIAPR